MNTLTVADILALDVLSHACIHSGAVGLSNAVTGITTADDPDLIYWLKGGEILVATIYDHIHHPFSYGDYIDELAEKKISALLVKTKKPLTSVPEELIAGGERHHIPVIELPHEVRFIDVISAVMDLMHHNESQYYAGIRQHMSELLTSGGNESEILAYLALYVPARISFCDADGNLLSGVSSNKFDPAVAIADRIRLPIMCMGEVNGYLEAVTNRFLDDNSEQLLKSAVSLLSILFLKKYYKAEIEQKYISAFLNDLFEGNLSPKQLEEKAYGYGWKDTDRYMAATVCLHSQETLSPKLPEALMEMAHRLPKSRYYFQIRDEYLHILFRICDDLSPEEIHSRMNETITGLHTRIMKKYRMFSFYAGISSIAQSVSQIPLKIREAEDALQFGHAFQNPIVKYEDLGVLRLLTAHTNANDLEQIIPPAVRRLADYDKSNNTQYLETLDSLLGNNLNLSKTAKQLFIHYKTMLHRMNRICEIAEISLDDRQTRLDIELGVKLYMMLPK